MPASTRPSSKGAADGSEAVSSGPANTHWTYLTNHAHVLLLLARDADLTMREVAQTVGITERAVQRIISELEEASVLERSRQGRRNTYTVNSAIPLRHPVESHCTVAELLQMVNRPLRRAGPPKA